MGRIVLLLGILMLLVAAVHKACASTITTNLQLTSADPSDPLIGFLHGNTTTGKDMPVVPCSDWPTGVAWVSPEDTGCGGTAFAPITTLDDPPTTIFWVRAFLPFDDNEGYLSIWSRDVSSLWVFNAFHPSGLLLLSPTGLKNGWTALLDNTILAKGDNVFTMPTWNTEDGQFANAHFGKIASRGIVPDPPPVSEPTYALLLAGVIAGLAFQKHRRRAVIKM